MIRGRTAPTLYVVVRDNVETLYEALGESGELEENDGLESHEVEEVNQKL